MADKKISQLTSGSPAQAADEYVVARSGANYKLTLTNIAASMPPIGATTPNTASFTTLTTSSTVTLNGGTANGVLYLNGSKVATSGTTLNFDGTRLLLGTTSTTTSSTQSGEVYSTGAVGFLLTNNTAANYALSVKNEGTSGTRRLINFYEGTGGGTARANISLDGSNGIALTVGSGTTTFDSSGNLGIGTTSPGTYGKLDVYQATDPGTTSAAISVRTAGVAAGTAVPQYGINVDASSSYNNASAMYGIRVVASQNLGNTTYGVHSTVNAGNSNANRWAIYGKANVNSDASHTLSGLPVGVYGEATNSTGTTNGSTSAAGYFLNSSTLGAVSYGVYIKTTAGPTTVIPLRVDQGSSELMRVTSGGDVGIGTASPGQKLEVAGNVRLSGSQVGSKIENQLTAISVTTSATTILDVAGSYGRLVVVNGGSASDRFCDLVLASTSVSPTVVSSFTAAGSPAARTYTRSGVALQLAMASGTYSVWALALGY